MSQAEMAAKLGVSFATVNRWEKGRCQPSQIAQKAIELLCEHHDIDYAQYAGNSVVVSDEVVALYHGSKSGLFGAIEPQSRDRCDFGKGFYMGTEKEQPLTLVCNYDNATLYTLRVHLSGLKMLDIEVGIDWALLVAFHRGKMEQAKGTALYERIETMVDGFDMVIGYIADDRMFVVLDRFFNGEITDTALINSLSALKLGRQYVAKTEKALDDTYDRLQWAGEEYILEELGDEVQGLKEAGKVFSREVMYWAGYTYRYWHYYQETTSAEIYRIADAETMNDVWLGFHTLDVEMAIDNLIEIREQKALRG